MNSQAVNLCKQQLNHIKTSLVSNSTWNPFANTNLPSNITHGNSYDFGNFDECLAVHHDTGLNDIGIIKGQHCMVQLYSSNDVIASAPDGNYFNVEWKHLSLRSGVGVCFPASCSSDDIREMISELLGGTNLKVAEEYNQSEYCKKVKPFDVGIYELLMIFALTILIFLVIISTLKDIKGIQMNKWIKPFSILTNGRNLFNIKPDKSPESISCLNGLKSITALCIVYAHCYLMRLFFPIRDPNQRDEYLSSPASAIPIGMCITVDTFFVISAALSTRNILKEMNGGRFNIFSTIARRYMRLTPLLMTSFLSVWFILTWSPPWPYFHQQSLMTPCKNYILPTLLHLQTYINYKDMCNPLTWYISVDWQLFLISPILIYPAWRYGKRFLTMLLTLVIASNYFSYKYASENGVSIQDINLLTLVSDAYYNLYLQTHYRSSVYFIGMALGYGLFIKKDFRLSPLQHKFLWILSCFTIIASIFLPFFWKLLNLNFSSKLNAIILTTYPNLYSLAICWIIYDCQRNPQGNMNKFLSYAIWKVISKLGYSIYLISSIVQIFWVSSSKHPIEIDCWTMCLNYVMDLMLSFPFVIAAHLLIEEPFSQIGKLFAYKLSDSKRKIN